MSDDRGTNDDTLGHHGAVIGSPPVSDEQVELQNAFEVIADAIRGLGRGETGTAWEADVMKQRLQNQEALRIVLVEGGAPLI